MFNWQNLIKDDKLARDAQAIYAFFTEAEASGMHFTYAKIRDYFPRSHSNISKYVRNYWSWFLRKEPEKQGRAHTFSCHGLQEYPEFYFVMAHQRNQGQYYRHFSEAWRKAKERDQEARRAKIQGTTEVSSSPFPNVPDQRDPEELHIEELPPDEEAEEDDAEMPEDLGEGTQQEEDDGTTSEIVQSKGGINLMSIFTLDKQLEQIRAEFTQKMDLLEQKLIEEVQRQGEVQRSHVPPEVSQVLKELGQLQEQVLALSSLTSQSTRLLERQGEMVARIRTIEQTLLGGMQQLYILTTLSQIPERLEQAQESLLPLPGQLELLQGQVSNLSASVAAMPTKLEQLQAKIQESLLPLPEQLELLQGRANDLSALVAAMPTKLEQLQTRIDELFSQVTQESPLLPILQELQRQIAEIAQPSSVPNTLEQLQGQIGEISSRVASTSGVLDALRQANERLRAELVPVIPSGEQRPDGLILAYIQKAIGEINALERNLAAWLDQHYLTLREKRQASYEKLRQDVASSIENHIASQLVQPLYRMQEDIPVSTEASPPSEQNIPLTDQPSEADTADDTTEEG